jgi:hypothetical protein
MTSDSHIHAHVLLGVISTYAAWITATSLANALSTEAVQFRLCP